MKSCNRKILELFYNAKHSGRIVKPDAIGRVGENNDGLVIELTWRVINDVIEDAKFRAFGNPNAIAITSLMTDNMIGKSVEDVMHMGEDIIIDNLGEFRPEYLETFDMVHMAIDEAHTNYLKRQSRKENVDPIEYYEHQTTNNEEVEINVVEQIQRELQPKQHQDGEKRGRGRPRKEVDPNAVVEVGEKRGRGRPRKAVEDNESEEVKAEKRGRGRPRKIVDETEIIEVGEKRGRGRPRKIVDESEVKDVPTEKRGRGRPRKEVNPNAVVEVGEKRGRGRPRKVVDETEMVQVGEKRGRGRPRKIIEEGIDAEPTEKRGRGRPRKEIKYNFPSDLDEVIKDKEVEELINGVSNPEPKQSNYIMEEFLPSKEIEEDEFDKDYDLFKSNIRSIFSGKPINDLESASQPDDKLVLINDKSKDDLVENTENENDNSIEDKTEEVGEKRGRGRPRKIVDGSESQDVVGEKRGRGRPRKEVDPNAVEEVGEKRGRGRPKKIVIETIEESESEKRGRGRPRRDTVSSLTRSLITAGGVPVYNNTQDIVFASKNVTTTNINVNITKTTTNIEDSQITSDDYSKDVNISRVEENSKIISPLNDLDKDEEIDVDLEDEVDINNQNMEDEIDDEDIDASHIKDEAPKGGIEDLLKALLGDE